MRQTFPDFITEDEHESLLRIAERTTFARVAELVGSGVGKPFGPAGKIFKEWLSVPTPDRTLWRDLLREGIAFVE